MNDQVRLAHERTDLAEDRTVLANERTYAGWMRTSFAAVGVGIGFQALFGHLGPGWLPKAIATLFLLIGAYVALAGERRAARAFARLSPHTVAAFPQGSLRVISWSSAVAALCLALALWRYG